MNPVERHTRTNRGPNRAAVCLLAGLVSAAALAQPRDLRFRRIALEDGLPAAIVSQVTQSEEGFIWLATQGGLSRYDGYDFVTYLNDPGDPTSLPHNDVQAVVQDREGRIWAGTDGGGLARFDPVTRAFKRYRHDPDDETSLSDDRVRCLLEDRDGVLWVGTDSRGLNRLDPESDTFERFRFDPDDPSSLGGDQIRQLAQGAEGTLWVATADGGLSALNPTSGAALRWRHDEGDEGSLSSDRARSLLVDRTGTLWVGTYDGGLNRFDRSTGDFDHFEPTPAEPGSLTNPNVTAILEDGQGTLWVGTEAGLDEWRPETESFRHHRHNGANPYSLTHDRVRSLFQDRSGVLWVGTLGGVSTWNASMGRFLHYLRRAEAPGELSDNWVTGFAETPDGDVWVGTIAGLNRLDVETGRFEQLRSDPADPASLNDDGILSLLVDGGGALWVGTLRGGLNRKEPGRDRFVHYVSDPNDPTSLSTNGVTSLVEDREGYLWAGTYRGGLNRLDPRTGRFTHFRHDPDDPTSLSSDKVTSIYQDGQGTLWVGTDDGGLNRFNRAAGSFIHYRHDPADPESLSGDDAWYVTGDAQGDLWIATRSSGANRWRAEDQVAGRARFQRYSTDDGLSSDVVYATVEDGFGAVWMSTNAGLSRLDLESDEFSNFDATRGLQSSEFNFASAARIGDELYLGGINGFNVFAPDRIGTNRNPPPVVLTSFRKFNEPVDVGPTAQVKRIELTHKDSVVGFEYAALDFTAPEANRYRYMLEGLDPDWVEAGGRRLVTYTNLDPGDYTFRVQASNSDGVWNLRGLAVGIGQAPPPWKSWWAYSIYALAVAALVLSTIAALETRKRRAEELARVNVSLEKEILTRKAKELALEAEKLKAREYLDVAEVVMVALDEDGTVRLINQKGCGVLGFEEDEIVGSDWVERFVAPQRRDEVRNILRNPDAFRYCEYPIVAKGGEERVVAWHSTRLPSAEGETPVVLSSGTDNTEVRKLEKQVRMRQKMDALGTLAGGIAHDFNNILTAILGYSSLTLSQLASESEESGYMRQVVQACERARDMVARILTFSRGGDGDKKPIEIGPTVQEACDLIHSSLPDTVELRTSIDPDCLPVRADPTQIHQVVMNLATNSSHAMSKGGLIEVSVEMVEDGPRSAERDELPSTQWVRITVKDDGHGMDKATLERVFDPFFTTKQVGSGTGLGLSVAHGIITSLEGEIIIRSEPGEGTEVMILLPCCEPIETAPAATSQETPRGSERVLLVDDEKPILLLTKRWLESLGYFVEPHADCVEALAAFRNRPQRFDLVVTDQSMPEMSGFELIEEVRRIRTDQPSVLTSGRHYRAECEEAGSVWLQKPFTLSELAVAVREALDGNRHGLRSVG